MAIDVEASEAKWRYGTTTESMRALHQVGADRPPRLLH